MFISSSVTDRQKRYLLPQNRFFMKLFTTKSIETVKYCQEHFDFSLLSVLWTKPVAKFELSFECILSVL